MLTRKSHINLYQKKGEYFFVYFRGFPNKAFYARNKSPANDVLEKLYRNGFVRFYGIDLFLSPMRQWQMRIYTQHGNN